MEGVVVVMKYKCRVDELMFGWKSKESSIPSLIYPNLFSYLLALSYIISRSKLVLNEAEQCPHSAPTTRVQRYDFISRNTRLIIVSPVL